jgi:hypothetical protein
MSRGLSAAKPIAANKTVGFVALGLSYALPFRTLAVAEFVDDVASRDRVERQRVDVVVGYKIVSKGCVVVAQRMLGPMLADVALAVMRGMKQQSGTALHANVSDPEKLRAGRLTMSLDSKQFAGPIVLGHFRVEAFKPAHAVARRRPSAIAALDASRKTIVARLFIVILPCVILSSACAVATPRHIVLLRKRFEQG